MTRIRAGEIPCGSRYPCKANGRLRALVLEALLIKHAASAQCCAVLPDGRQCQQQLTAWSQLAAD
eukprot:2393900-Lingulodinium_polyedra.AAC.1